MCGSEAPLLLSFTSLSHSQRLWWLVHGRESRFLRAYCRGITSNSHNSPSRPALSVCWSTGTSSSFRSRLSWPYRCLGRRSLVYWSYSWLEACKLQQTKQVRDFFAKAELLSFLVLRSPPLWVCTTACISKITSAMRLGMSATSCSGRKPSCTPLPPSES